MAAVHRYILHYEFVHAHSSRCRGTIKSRGNVLGHECSFGQDESCGHRKMRQCPPINHSIKLRLAPSRDVDRRGSSLTPLPQIFPRFLMWSGLSWMAHAAPSRDWKWSWPQYFPPLLLLLPNPRHLLPSMRDLCKMPSQGYL